MHMSRLTATPVPAGNRFDAPAAGQFALLRRYPITALLVLTFRTHVAARGPDDSGCARRTAVRVPVLGLDTGLRSHHRRRRERWSGGRETLFARVIVWKVRWPWYLLVIGGTA